MIWEEDKQVIHPNLMNIRTLIDFYINNFMNSVRVYLKMSMQTLTFQLFRIYP